MTMNWKRTETADGAGAEALGVGCLFSSRPVRPIRIALRRERDAVCREAADAESEAESVSGVPGFSSDSSITRTIFFSSRIQSQPSTRKETPKTTQKKKGKATASIKTRTKLETLA